MRFTYAAYEQLLTSMREKGYRFRDYLNWKTVERSVILRHDIDDSLCQAVFLSEIEKNVCGGDGATYFVLLTTEFYNVASLQSRRAVDKIMANGGRIGLHFDETQYEIHSKEEMVDRVMHEAGLLSKILDIQIETVSMHRPSKAFLNSDMEFPGICNAYADCFFKEMKYVSDSRRNWREDVEKIVSEGTYDRLHVLTHPILYNEKEDADIREAMLHIFRRAYMNFYDNMDANMTALSDVITREEVERMIEL